MKMAKLMTGLGLYLATLMIVLSSTPVAHSQDINLIACKGNCQAKKAIMKMKRYNLDLKKKLADPLGSEVCKNQLKGNVSKLKRVDVCLFKDSSAIELTSLHKFSESFANPTP